MKAVIFVLSLLQIIAIASCSNCVGEIVMPESLAAHQRMYIIERDVPDAGSLTHKELIAISQSSCNVLKELGSEIQWLYSYVAVDKLYCVFTAPNEEMVREHARQGGLPVDLVSRVFTIINPSTASD